MKTTKKTRTRCECDYCGKKNWSAYHMRKHEKRCTMNPARHCGACEIIGEQPQAEISTLKAIIPRDLPESDAGRSEIVSQILPALEEAAGGCPWCMLAAIRQRGIERMDLVIDFDPRKMMASIFAEQDPGCNDYAGYEPYEGEE